VWKKLPLLSSMQQLQTTGTRNPREIITPVKSHCLCCSWRVSDVRVVERLVTSIGQHLQAALLCGAQSGRPVVKLSSPEQNRCPGCPILQVRELKGSIRPPPCCPSCQTIHPASPSPYSSLLDILSLLSSSLPLVSSSWAPYSTSSAPSRPLAEPYVTSPAQLLPAADLSSG